ncbi:MAG: aldehyde dehydrogenase family protein, partial [Patescibacteria group bacterium]
MPIQTQNPYTEKIEKIYKSMSDGAIAKKIESAHKAHLKWKEISIKKRGVILKKVAKNLLANKEKYAKVIVREMGKPITQSISEIEKCALNCEFYADNAEKFLTEEIHDTEYKHARVAFEPIGIVFAVMPWNFPFWQVFRFAAPALMAGNSVVLKHASNVPECTLLMEKIFIEAGAFYHSELGTWLPKDLFTSLLAQSKQVEKIIVNKYVRAITLTGSEGAGSAVASIAGREIKKAVLELGGADPFVILSNVDLEKAVAAAVQSRIPNAGQVCVSGKRFIIEKSLVEKAIMLIKEKTEKIIVGDPMDPKTEMGPLAKADIRDEVAKQVADSIKKGAKCV